MRRFVTLQKEIGQTPLAAINAWRARYPAHADTPATYAGRLDPMAEGTLLVLLGDECKRQDQYRRLDKEYEIEVLLDLSTDTGDVLGMASYAGRETRATDAQIAFVRSRMTGTRLVPYPAFSSKTVGGKSLFQYALEGTLDTIETPEHEETVHDIQILGIEQVGAGTLQERIASMLARVPRVDTPAKRLGEDFRQDMVRARWKEIFTNLPKRKFMVLHLRVACASGTYMRTLAERIGTALDTRAMALSIRRTRIGKYAKLGPFGFWYRAY